MLGSSSASSSSSSSSSSSEDGSSEDGDEEDDDRFATYGSKLKAIISKIRDIKEEDPS